MTVRLVDFHCHLDLYPDHAGIVEECERLDVLTLTVTTTPRAWPRNRELTSRTRNVRSALGLHPQLAADRADEITIFERYLPGTRFVGEVGLDAGPRFYRGFAAQQAVFERILRACAEHGDKVLSIHSVRAASKVLDHVEKHLPADRGTIVLHWFTGTAAEARRAVDLGCFFSINAQMLQTPRQLKLVSGLPLERMLTETDGPFVAQADRPIRPRDVEITTQALAAVLGRPLDLVARSIDSNARLLVGE